MRAEIAEMPDGVYYAQDCMEDDGVTDRPYWMRLRLTIQGDEAICDWIRLRRPGARADQRHLRRHRCLLLQRLPPRRLGRHPDQLRLLPADPAGHPARQRWSMSSTPGRRSAATRRPTRTSRTSSCGRWPGAVPDRVAADRGGDLLQLPVRRVPPRVRRLLHELSHRGERLGRHRRPRRQQRALPEQRQLPQHAGRDPGDEIPVHRRAIRAAQRLGGRRPLARRPGQLAHLPRHRAGDHRQRPVRPHQDAGARHLRRSARRQQRHLHQAAAATTEFRRFSEVFGTVSDSKFTRVVVTEGDEIMLNSAGGGGYGNPLERARELVEEDVRQGFVSPEAAARDYGYRAADA